MKIKICGIKTPEHALVAAKAGADFIGMIFAADSKRRVSTEEAKAIVAALKNTQVIPVAVFAEQTADQIMKICKETQINVAQLHGDEARAAIRFLPSNLRIMTAIRVSSEGEINQEDLNLSEDRSDFLLFDAEKGGSGKPFAWKNFLYKGKQPWLLSGGLNPNNVTDAIRLLQPDGVDVSSGVESNGVKDPELIIRFIEAVRHHESRHS